MPGAEDCGAATQTTRRVHQSVREFVRLFGANPSQGWSAAALGTDSARLKRAMNLNNWTNLERGEKETNAHYGTGGLGKTLNVRVNAPGYLIK
jgi:hypothetical protein